MNSDNQNTQQVDEFDVDKAWAVLLMARTIADSVQLVRPMSLYYDEVNSKVEAKDGVDTDAVLRVDQHGEWICSDALGEQAKALFDLYLPFLAIDANASLVIGHLGQSVDAQIATASGDAIFVTGAENRKHLHRMRALAHGVIVGVETVVADDPQLTTRAVSGPSPIRVVIDPSARMPAHSGLLNDNAATTWQLHGPNAIKQDAVSATLVNRIEVPVVDNCMSMCDVISALVDRGLRRLFVEGGGVTVSGMLTDNCLDYLQIAAAPVFVGAGRPAIQLCPAQNMQQSFRPPYTLYRMGADVLWNFDVRQVDASSEATQRRLSSTPELDHLPALQRLI